MQDNRTDYARGLDRGLELALGIINKTADTNFDSIPAVALYLYRQKRDADLKLPLERESA
jgi:hypothetical protein